MGWNWSKRKNIKREGGFEWKVRKVMRVPKKNVAMIKQK